MVKEICAIFSSVLLQFYYVRIIKINTMTEVFTGGF